MAVLTQIPASNVQFTDIRDTLNANGSSCTNDVISFFDSRAVINIWSFRKPYSSNADMFKLTDAQIRTINCGLTPKQVSSYTSIPSYMDGNMNGWVYTRPSGGENSPYRVGDYVRYYPGASPMIRDLQVPATVSNQFSNTISVSAIVGQQDGKSVTLKDLLTLADAYPAIYIKQASGSQSRQYKGSSKISESGTFDVSFDASLLTVTGDWYVYPFLSMDGLYYTIPNLSMKTINVVSTFFSISVKAQRDSSGIMAINYTITVKNNSSAVTWTNNTWKLRYNGKSFTDTMVSGETQGTLTSPQTIAGNTTTTITGTITNISSALWAESTMVFWASFNSGNHVQSAVILSLNS